MAAKKYEYRWGGDHPGHLGSHSFTNAEGVPEGVSVTPGENFRTDEPVDQLEAIPVSADAKAARDKADREREAAAQAAEAAEAAEAGKEESAKTEGATAPSKSEEKAP